MSLLAIDFIGWTGSGLLVLSYILISNKKIDPESIIYQGMNVAGSALLVVNTSYHGSFPSTAINAVWIIIGLFYIHKKI